MASRSATKKDKTEELKKPRGKLELTALNKETGLTAEQVKERTLKGYANTPVESPTKTVKQIILGNILTYFNLIFVILAVCLLVVGAIKDITFMIIVIINTTVGIVQQLNAKKTLDKLTIISEPRIRVIRDGTEYSVASADLVQGDLVIFEHGSQICADARVCQGSVRVNESLVTGESDEIEKGPGDTLLSGSFIVSGQCSAILEKVGDESFVSHLTLEAKKDRKKAKGMMYSLDNLVKVIGVVLIPVGVLLFLRHLLTLGIDLQTNVSKTTAALIGMIPEGLYLLADIALTVSIIKLAKKKTLVHDMKCIETLARVDVLCVDKTGTITEDRMSVKDFIVIEPSYCSEQAARKLIGDFVGNMDTENNTMMALKETFSVTAPRKATETVAFSSVTKCSSASFSDNTTFILGAPEFALGEMYQQYSKVIERYAADGNRVLVFCELTPVFKKPLAFILLQNNIRPDAKKTFGYFTEQGVEIKVISGDNPLTAAAAAAQAGIPNSDKSVNLALVPDEKFEEAVLTYTVFGRVTPDQKRRILRILKENGHTVAMTGDGVNDVLALKEADCSIAMASGSEVASQISQLVLLDSNFSSMPHIVSEGRKVINNIQRSASLFIVKNIFSLFMALLAIIIAFEYPFAPRQITLVSALTIGLPGFLLALEKNNERVKGKFIKNIILKALPGGLTDIVVVSAVLILADAFSIPMDMATTMATLLMCFVGIGVVIMVSWPLTWRRGIFIGIIVVLLVLAIVLLSWYFTLVPLTKGPAVITGILTLLIPSLLISFSKTVEVCETGYYKLKEFIIKKKNEADEEI